jgi:oligosaccharyltransferase complex subunit beta
LSSEQAVPSAVSSLLLELDITLPPDRNSIVVDHFNYDTKSASEKHEVLLLQSPKFSKKETKNFFSVGNVLAFPHAVGQVLGNASPLLQSVLKAPNTAYIYNHKESESEALEDIFATGEQISLVTTFQARNSARFTVLGSAEALEDKYFTATVQLPGSSPKSTKTGNRDFARQLSAWTFKELGVLRVNNIEHHLNEATQSSSKDVAALDPNPSIYRIKNDVAYSISLSEWDTDHWKPFVPPPGDELQLEFSMLSPFHRLNLVPTSKTDNATTFTTEFKLPDQHGIFNFYTEYRRPFYTNVEEKRTVTVRHFAHDEWPRSFVISGAWPWISGIWVTVLGWLGFVALWLYSKPAQPKSDMRAGKR